MCQSLSQLDNAMRAYAASFDVDALAPGDLKGALAAAGRVEKVAAALWSLIAARLAQTGPGGDQGSQGEADLARQAGTSRKQARQALKAGRAMVRHPELGEAARSGELSRQQAALISEAAEDNPEATGDLVRKAAQLSLSELGDEAARAKAAKTSSEERRRRVYAARSLHCHTDPYGTWHINGQGLPEHGAQVEAVLAELTNGIFGRARAEGRREGPEAYRFDALMALVAMASGQPQPNGPAPAPTDDNAGADGPGSPSGSDEAGTAGRPTGPGTAGGRTGPGTAGQAEAGPCGGTKVERPAQGQFAIGDEAPGNSAVYPEGAGTPPAGPQAPLGSAAPPVPQARGTDAEASAPSTASPANGPTASPGAVASPTPAASPTATAFPTPAAVPTATASPQPKLGRLRPSFMVRVDLGALLRGYPAEGEICEIAGFGPISVQAAIDMLGTQDPFLKCIVTDGVKVVGVAHLGRRPNAYQRSALDWLYPTCAAEGCNARSARLQTDHRQDWAKTHFTVFDLLDRLCPLHHRLKTNDNWALVQGQGKRAFVPPDDPRHPRHARGPRGPNGNGTGSGARPPPH